MHAGLFQFSPELGKVQKNMQYIHDKLDSFLSSNACDLMVLPELAFSGYFISSSSQAMEWSQTLNGNEVTMLGKMAVKHNCAIVCGIAEQDNLKVFNSSVCITPSGVKYCYRKTHLFSNEKNVFSRTQDPIEVIPLDNGIKIAMLICFDHLFPEAARTAALKGAHIICHPSNLVLPGTGQLTTRVRSIENRIYWILSNRTGSETVHGKTLEYTGNSRITGPGGNILYESGRNEAITSIQIDPFEANDKKITDMDDVFKDRRIDIYSLNV